MFEIRRYVGYLKYVLRHKWYVMSASRKVDVGFFRALVHDASKLLPGEFFPYAYTFYEKDGTGRYKENDGFNVAWNHHQKRNKHHWQYWILKMDRGEDVVLKMPEKYVREMVADWAGAGKAITGEWEVGQWYDKNSDIIILDPETKDLVSKIIWEEFWYCTQHRRGNL